jgi:hypothetical protein
MKKIAVVLLLCFYGLGIGYAQPVKLSPFISFYGKGGMNEAFEGDMADSVDFLAAEGYSSEGETKSSLGWGIGAELIKPIDNYDIGLMGEFIGGPTIEQKLTLVDEPSYWFKSKTETLYARAMVTGGARVKTPAGNYFKVGTGIGMAYGNTTQTLELSNDLKSLLGPVVTYDYETWTGFTYMVGASFIITGKRTDIEFGARYSGLPELKRDDFVKIEYMPISIFGSLRFSLN